MVAGEAALVIGLGVADVRREPDAGSELVTQALLNVPAMPQEFAGGWVRVRLPDYEGWVAEEALAPAPMRREYVAVVCAPRAPLFAASWGDAVRGQVYATTRLPLLAQESSPAQLRVALPGGGDAWIAGVDAEARPAFCPFQGGGPQAAVAHARRYLGAPYLWGGVTVDGADCSGFVQVCWRAAGCDIPRDAGPQFEALPYMVGRGELLPGDLLFFGRGGAITHVALSLGGERFIHAKGSPESCVLINSFDSRDAGSAPALAAIYMGARRVAAEAHARAGAA
jgi:cell wall-associated NlpC family hydrolase